MLAQRLERDVLHLVKLRGRDEDHAVWVPEGEVQQLSHPVEGLPRLPSLQVRDKVAPIPQERVHILVGIVPQPLPAEPDRVSRQGPLRPRIAPLSLPPLPQPPSPAPQTPAQASQPRYPALSRNTC